MPISGIVVTLAPEVERRESALCALRDHPNVTLGEAVETRLPLVTETETMTEHDEVWSQLEKIEGVLQIRLAFHDFSDVEETFPRRRARGG